jgi:3-oxoacyl-[acyl-carrier protein] reductase
MRGPGALSGSYRKAALVTGASRGIGRAVALELGRAGFDVGVNYARSAEAAAEVVRELKALGVGGVPLPADVADPQQRQLLVDQTLEAFGRIDVLVNNAGIPPLRRGDLLEVTEESFARVLAVDLVAPFFLSQRVAVEMLRLRREGRLESGYLVNISSISAYTISTDRAEYCVAKAGLSMVTKLFAARLAEESIWVYEIRPGIIETDMTAAVRTKYDRLIREGLTPIRRWGRPEDVARAVVLVVTGQLTFSTGEVLNVDGGFHLRRF